MKDKEELLKAIEQKRQEIRPTDTGEMKPNNLELGWLNALTWMKDLINSLPSEKSSKQLCWNDMTEEEKSDFFFNLSHQIQIEKPSEDLEEELDNYCVHGDIRNPNFEGPFGYNDIRKTAVHFANWQKEQMMKTAIDAIITSRWKDSHVCLTTNKDIPQIYNGDRVKIIIVKEGKQ